MTEPVVVQATVCPPPGQPVAYPTAGAAPYPPAAVAAMPVPQMMKVKVPPGHTGGTKMQVDTPVGPMMVDIPEHLAEGQEFEFAS